MTSSYLRLTFKPLIFLPFLSKENILETFARRTVDGGISAYLSFTGGDTLALAAAPPEAGASRPWPYSCGDKRHCKGAGLRAAGYGVAPMPHGTSRVTTTRYQMSPGKGAAKGTERPGLKTELKSMTPGLSEATTGPSSVYVTSVFLEGDWERGR